ncbi:glycoside hydrolase family 127 protein [Haladaptatus pallidirubidus]|uniref:Glycoside hydrolase family 127 protein n=1 Tax=Haladaptatus pallidirubidus TaxID=1008152 RepID=A0AAV3USG1_9EURY|nr:beta-L-arabinofuranosidase domain-containing protein [Haladaptatus pallidirubidus]
MSGYKPTTDKIALSDVEIDDQFWSPRVTQNREVTIEYQYKQLEESGTLENFQRARDGKNGGFQGMWFQDSDAYKWLEAASYELTKANDTDLRERVDEVIDLVAAAQEDSGYLNTYFKLVEPEMTWTNLNIMHELYCGGHLIEAAVAHYEATGEESLLDVAVDFADHVDDVFDDQIDGIPGHEEIELALVKLYRITGEERYLDLAQYFVNLRGHDDRFKWELEHSDEIGGHSWDDGALIPAEGGGRLFLDEDGEYVGTYAQAHASIREQEKVEGHSVRAMYLFAGATDLVAETGDEELFDAMERLWENMTTKRMYVTGGIGPEREHEGFTEDYDLRNEDAYAETCAAIGSIFWNQRMLELTGGAKYANLIERTMYNGFLAGISLDGTRFFYENPLESSGDHHRKGWFTCACCPPNAARLFASLGKYVYSNIDGVLTVNQYVGSTVTTTIDGFDVELTQSSSLPWSGEVTLTVDADGPVPIRLRIPEWATDVSISVDGEDVEQNDDYVELDGEWSDDTIDVHFELDTKLIRAHPAVKSDAGRVVVERGPLVYCAEAVDNDRPIHQYTLSLEAVIDEEHRDDLLDGVTVLQADAEVPSLDGWNGSLYRPDEETDIQSVQLTMVPYYAWDNREPSEMHVWTRVK